ncbi:MAG: hypothetical protein WBW48_09410 [Anaerolineae bacterium]
MSNVEVDQSGRMEMAGKTTVAVSNDFTVTVRVTARVKQEVRQALLERGVKSRMVMIHMFVGVILLAIRDYLEKIHLLTIDEEYTGYEATIKSLLLDRIRALGFEFPRESIMITRVGKKSPAHRAAIRVTRRHAKADKTPSAEELLLALSLSKGRFVKG